MDLLRAKISLRDLVFVPQLDHPLPVCCLVPQAARHRKKFCSSPRPMKNAKCAKDFLFLSNSIDCWLPVDRSLRHIRTHPSRYNGCHHLRCFRRRGPPGLRRQDRVSPRPRGRPRGAQARVRGDLRLGGRNLPPCCALHLHRKCLC